MPPRRNARSPPRGQPQHDQADEICREADEICEIKGRLAMAERNLRRVVFLLFLLLLCLLAKSPLDQIMLFNQARNKALEELGKPRGWLGREPSKPTAQDIFDYWRSMARTEFIPAPWGMIAKTVTNYYYNEAWVFYLENAHDPGAVTVIAKLMAAGVLVLFVYVNLRTPGTVLTIAATMAAGVVLFLFALVHLLFSNQGSLVICW